MGELRKIAELVPMAMAPNEHGLPESSSDVASLIEKYRKATCRKCSRRLAACGCDDDAPKKSATTLESLKIDREFWGAKLADFDPELARMAALVIERPELARGGLVTGSPGTGKTRLLVALVQNLLEAGKRPQFYLARRLFGRLSAVYSDAPAETEYAAIGDLTGCEFLAIDDLGHEGKPSDFVVGALHEIIATRHGNFRPTVISTNLTQPDIAARYDDAIASRIGSWLPIVMDGRDWRA